MTSIRSRSAMGLAIALCLSCLMITEAQSQRPAPTERSPAVDVSVAQSGSLDAERRYTGTTQPLREVTLRTRTEGLLLELSVDIGDRVQQGQILGQLDPTLLQAALIQVKAQLASQQSEVAQAQAQLSNARTQVEQARLNWLQQQADAERLNQLAEQGAISTQQAEQAMTAARTAEQALRSAEDQVRTQAQAVNVAQQQVQAEASLVDQAEARLSHTELLAPLSGVVMARLAEPGVFLSAGADVLTLGDFSQVKVEFPISELELSKVATDQPIQVQLDAFPAEKFTGRVTRISPAADPQARVVPVEVQIPNNTGRIGSGLLARVQIISPNPQQVVVPQTAVQEQAGSPTVFVIDQHDDTTRVSARPVQLGMQQDGQVEITEGLTAGERYVVRSATPLQDGQEVQLSIISDTTGS